MSDLLIKICSSFRVALPNYPVSCRIANPNLFGEVLSDGMLLIYGGYELVFCCNCREDREDVYSTVIIPRTFMEKFLPEKTGLSGGERVQVLNDCPLSVEVRAGRSSRASIWELLVGIIRDRTWMEVDVGGEISVRVDGFSSQNGVEICPANVKDVSKESSVQKRAPEASAVIRAGKNIVPGAQFAALRDRECVTLDLDSLADLVIRIIQQRETVLFPQYPSGNQIDHSKEKPGNQYSAEKTEMDVLSEILRRIVARGEKETSQQGEATVKSQDLAGFDLSSIPLEKIPSRPGIQQTFVQNVPPPKPPGGG